MERLVLTFLLVFILGCTSSPEKTDLKKDQLINDTVVENPEDAQVNKIAVIKNTTNFSIESLLEAQGDIFADPNSVYYYSIGKHEIGFADDLEKFFLIPGWKLQVDKDTIIFIKNKIKNNTISPKAFINYTYPNKYNKISNNYTSDYFGQITIKENGLSCDDSYSGEIIIINKEGKQLSISDLANIDIFESKDKELYILSYHNCLLPNLKIIRIK